MAFHVTIVDAREKPLPAGLVLVLLGDGAPLARAAVREGGAVVFDADIGAARRLAVRLDAEASPAR